MQLDLYTLTLISFSTQLNVRNWIPENKRLCSCSTNHFPDDNLGAKTRDIFLSKKKEKRKVGGSTAILQIVKDGKQRNYKFLFFKIAGKNRRKVLVVEWLRGGGEREDHLLGQILYTENNVKTGNIDFLVSRPPFVDFLIFFLSNNNVKCFLPPRSSAQNKR